MFVIATTSPSYSPMPIFSSTTCWLLGWTISGDIILLVCILLLSHCCPGAKPKGFHCMAHCFNIYGEKILYFAGHWQGNWDIHNICVLLCFWLSSRKIAWVITFSKRNYFKRSEERRGVLIFQTSFKYCKQTGSIKPVTISR